MRTWSEAPFFLALAGLDPAIYVFLLSASDKDVDPRITPGTARKGGLPGGGGAKEVSAAVRC